MERVLPGRIIGFFVLLAIIAISSHSHAAGIGAPHLSVGTAGGEVQARWSEVDGADGHLLLYAPYPHGIPVQTIDMGSNHDLSIDLPMGAAFYVAIQAYDSDGRGDLSNIEFFELPRIEVPNPGVDGLAAHYSFDEGYGITALDGSGSEKHGVITVASRVEGKMGAGLFFGPDSGRVVFEQFIDFPDGLVTMEAWIKPYMMD